MALIYAFVSALIIYYIGLMFGYITGKMKYKKEGTLTAGTSVIGEYFSKKIKSRNIKKDGYDKHSFYTSTKKLDKLIGMDSIKEKIKEDLSVILNKRKKGKNIKTTNLHTVFTGKPGTGKTTVARLLGDIYNSLGLLSTGNVVEVSREDLVAGHVGQTAIKTKEKIKQAQGGILFIDEAYRLYNASKSDFGQEAIDTILKAMEDNRSDFMVIVAGYEDEMEDFLNSNPGLKSRFAEKIHFPDYSPAELVDIFKLINKKTDYKLTKKAKKMLFEHFKTIYQNRSKNFGNGRYVRNLYEKIEKRLAVNNKDLIDEVIIEEVISINEMDQEQLQDKIKELNQLIGLNSTKKSIKDLIDYVKHNKRLKENNIETDNITLHTVFTGKPGTGKTTVARLLGDIYNSLGLLSTGNVVEVSREDLVAGHVGQTAIKTKEKIKQAQGGILFIDEAYRLYNASKSDFGQEAIDTILKAMEDNRSDFMVIVAGYEDEMEDFLNSNPGLKSRFAEKIHFPDYSPAELVDIFKLITKNNKYLLDPNSENILFEHFEKIYQNRSKSFGNARYVRNLFEKAKKTIAKRTNKLTDKELKNNKNKLITFNEKDIKTAIKEV